MIDKDSELIYEAYEEKNFEDYFRFDGMQPLNLEGTKALPLFTLMQPLKPFELHSTYAASTLEKKGVKVPSKYFKKPIEESISSSKNLIVVDIQPFYHHWHKNITPRLLEYINESSYENILWFFNAQEVGIEEDHVDLREYITDYDILDEEKYNDIVLIDKYYAFFRNWMDMGIDEELIIKFIKYMISKDIVDSRDIDEDTFKAIVADFYGLSPEEVEDNSTELDDLHTDNIHIPHFEWGAIKNLGSVDICGGGRNECLREMELLLEAVGVKVNRIERFIYGE